MPQSTLFKTINSPLHHLLLTLFAISLIANVHGAQILNVEHPDSTVTISSTSPSFVFELSFPNAFAVSLENTTESRVANFCQATFEEISSTVQSQVPLNIQGEPLYENVVANENFTFILDTKSLNVIGVDSITGKTIYIPTLRRTAEKPDPDEAFFAIADDSRALYIVTKELLLSYSLEDFYKAVSEHSEIPQIKTYGPNFPGFSAVETVKYYQSNLYIVADKVVHIWFCLGGEVAAVSTVFDERFLGAPGQLSIVDITFQGNYAYLLDSLNGVYIVDISRAKDQHFRSLGLGSDIRKGQLIQAAGTSLNIISASSKTVLLNEYSINKLDDDQISLEFNRQSEIYQSIISLEADDTFLYLITGFFNIIMRHSIPSRYDSIIVDEALFDFWPLYRLDAYATMKRDYGSGLVVVRDKAVSAITFTKNPLLKCDMEGVQEGKYNAYVLVRENTCDAKVQGGIGNDANIVCETKQNINLLVASENSDLGDISWSYKATIGLIAGIIVLLILVLVFCCLFRKYKNQYEHLQSKIKFKKLKQGGKKGNDKGSDGSFNEGAGNVGDWRQKATGTTGAPNFQNWESQEKKKQSVQDLGDLKQLDYDDIYSKECKK